MYKKIMFMTLIMMIGAWDSHAQYKRLTGTNVVETHLGFSQIGLHGGIFLGRQLSREIVGKVGASVGVGKRYDITLTRIYVDAMASFNVARPIKTFFIDIVPGISLNSDITSKFKTDLNKKQLTYNYGFILGLEGEYHLSSEVVFLAIGNYRYYLRENNGQKRFQVGIGLRFTI